VDIVYCAYADPLTFSLVFCTLLSLFLKQNKQQAGAYPSPLNYHGFPKSCCTSVNEVICHGIPDDRALQEGDIINLDITVYLDGFHGDCSEMFVAGEPDEKGRALLQTTYDSWISACQFVKPGNDYKDIGAIIEDYIVPRGFSTVRNFCGHGIGQTFHTTPNILHYRNNEPNGQMTVGHTFTIEPMVCIFTMGRIKSFQHAVACHYIMSLTLFFSFG
jgi:methionyl aminopeptidase